jgi:hypothetical protein
MSELFLLLVFLTKLSKGSYQIASFIDYSSTDKYTITTDDIFKNLNIISAINAKGRRNFTYAEKYTWEYLTKFEILTRVKDSTKLYQIFVNPENTQYIIQVILLLLIFWP